MPEVYNAQAEDAVIASIILDPKFLDQVDLEVQDFFQKDAQLAWQAILALKGRGVEIDELTVREEGKKIGLDEKYIPYIISETPFAFDCLHHAKMVKDYSRKRRLLQAIEQVKQKVEEKSFEELVDDLRSSLDSFNYEGMASRFAIFSNPRKVETDPPIYWVRVSTLDGSISSDIEFTPVDFDSPTLFRRKVRNKLDFEPIIPNFRALINHLTRNAQHITVPKDASKDETICNWIKDWFKNATEAEMIDDLNQGYVSKDGYYWFHGDSLLGFLKEKAKVKVNKGELISILAKHGLWEDSDGNRSKVIRLKDGTKRVWGLPKSFFTEEVEEEQKKLIEETEEIEELEEIGELGEPEKETQEEDDYDWLN